MSSIVSSSSVPSVEVASARHGELSIESFDLRTRQPRNQYVKLYLDRNPRAKPKDARLAYAQYCADFSAMYAGAIVAAVADGKIQLRRVTHNSENGRGGCAWTAPVTETPKASKASVKALLSENEQLRARLAAMEAKLAALPA